MTDTEQPLYLTYGKYDGESKLTPFPKVQIAQMTIWTRVALHFNTILFVQALPCNILRS